MTDLAAEIYGKFQLDTEEALAKKNAKVQELEKMIGRGKRQLMEQSQIIQRLSKRNHLGKVNEKAEMT